MQRYEVTAPLGVSVHSGVLKLSEAQAKRRADALKEVKKGEYQVIKPVSFKLGEVFTSDQPIEKSAKVSVVEVKKKAPAKKAPVIFVKAETVAEQPKETKYETTGDGAEDGAPAA